ncbi:uncharacterized protein LOC119335716 [Triticum dicoccoides]|uniref:uncharacterized protein LOC119335716 n=1 Tax=Triticum dicoccoides TaxID=85692 RepID=UPI00189100B6|nr:uncharacterized protein LOC119335716 [Triticum dicoccoides]
MPIKQSQAAASPPRKKDPDLRRGRQTTRGQSTQPVGSSPSPIHSGGGHRCQGIGSCGFLLLAYERDADERKRASPKLCLGDARATATLPVIASMAGCSSPGTSSPLMCATLWD